MLLLFRAPVLKNTGAAPTKKKTRVFAKLILANLSKMNLSRTQEPSESQTWVSSFFAGLLKKREANVGTVHLQRTDTELDWV